MTRAVRPSNTTRTTLAGAEPVLVTGGVDTHKDTHTAAAVDGAGRVLGTAQFPATHAGYRALLAWLRRHADDHGQLALVGVEGTGAYGAGLTRHLQDEGVRVVEVDRPDRKTRRFQGKSDPIDAVAAALAALSGRQDGTPKDRTGATESIRLLRVPRRGAVRARAKVMVQIKAVIVTAPEQLRATLTPMADRDLIATLAASRPDRSGVTDPAVAVRVALRQLARQYQYLTEEINDLDALLAPLVAQTGHRRRQPRPDHLRGRLRRSVRSGAGPCLLRQDQPAPAQPRRRPQRQRRALHDRALPTALGPRHPHLRRSTHPRRQDQEGDRPLPQAACRPRGLPGTTPTRPPRPSSRSLTIHRSIPLVTARC
jgi:hypothetical protein